MTFELIGLGADRYREQLRDTALSMHNLSEEERDSIVGYRLGVTAAIAGETLTELSLRAENSLTDELTAVVNDLPVDAVLEDGDLVKVVHGIPNRRQISQPDRNTD
jgi:predicted Zn-dependent protease